MREFVRRVWSEPRAPDPPPTGVRDGLLTLGVLALCIVEIRARPELTWSTPSVALGIVLLGALLLRRSQPLLVVVVAFGAHLLFEAFESTYGQVPQLNTMGFMLLLPYALVRWGSGRETVAGAAMMLGTSTLNGWSTGAPLSEFIGAYAVLSAASAIGAAVRYRDRSHRQALEQVKMQEREQIARDLHDTVAHHVSAIAIRAQAGRAVAASDPSAAIDALEVIEREASRTLGEMRAMVRTLRRDEPAERSPTPRIADLIGFATSSNGPPVDVDISGDVDQLPEAVSATIYRIAQESITNARRHARHATRIEVGVKADGGSVQLCVADDGEHADRATPGYGLMGMSERAAMLGGSCEAGPLPHRGWTVTAVVPIGGA